MSAYLDIIRLARSENVGPRTFFNLIKLFGSASDALDKIGDLSIKGGRSKPVKICSSGDISKEVEAAEKMGAKIITYKSPSYPALLRQISDPPPVITCLGRIELLSAEKKLAIVGSRNASANARIFTHKIAQELAGAGITTVSGLARGIDACAHSAARDATIAVLAGGIDNIYPPENKELYKQLSREGLIVSEMPLHTQPAGHLFPQRNRIISGISLGCLVVEASLKSGSLITANQCLEQNRELFAVPGFPLDPRSMGTNKLLKSGAHLVENAGDLISVLQSFSAGKNALRESTLDDDENFNVRPHSEIDDSERATITNLLSAAPVSIDDLCQQTGIGARAINVIITELELAGKINRHLGSKVSRRYT